MAEFDAGAFMKDIVSGLASISESVKVIGEPVEAAGKTIIPAVVARVAFGAGGGGGSSPTDKEGEREKGAGGGGGGGAMLTPVFLVVDEEGERLLTVPSGLSSAVEKARSALDRVMPRKQGKGLEDDEELQDLQEGGSGAAD
ncbi:MAG: spore germination protein GerW family protein [Armatimonadota bacterium]|nr:spore germination protein GerW family protein [Armatimonadota bacterium]